MDNKVRPLTADEWIEWVEEWRRQGEPTKKNGGRLRPFEFSFQLIERERAAAVIRLQKAEREKPKPQRVPTPAVAIIAPAKIASLEIEAPKVNPDDPYGGV